MGWSKREQRDDALRVPPMCSGREKVGAAMIAPVSS